MTTNYRSQEASSSMLTSIADRDEVNPGLHIQNFVVGTNIGFCPISTEPGCTTETSRLLGKTRCYCENTRLVDTITFKRIHDNCGPIPPSVLAWEMLKAKDISMYSQLRSKKYLYLY